MKKFPLVAALMLIISLNAQNENKKWYFGQNAGLDFTSGSPVTMSGSAMNTIDNSATISDGVGNIQFYTDGVTVWNRLNNVMSNGTGLLGAQSGGQPATIVPHPGNANLYYVFTCDVMAGSNGLRYSIVDMSQQSGLGAVTATKNVLIYTPCTEKVIAVRHCNRRDYWLITHAWNSNEFKVYLINNNGFSPAPVSSYTGSIHTGGANGNYNSMGQITVSPEGNRIALSLYSDGIVEILDFNNSTGQVTNPVTINGYTNAWGVEFSPNGNVLYISRWVGSEVWQVNLLAGNAAAIQASTYSVGVPSGPHPSYKSAYMKRGPDGKIYIAKWTSPFLAVVNNPDVLGSGCNFVDNGYNLGGPTSGAGFDNCVFQSISFPTIVASGVCQNQFNLTDTTDVLSVNWNFGDPSSSSNTSTSYSPTHAFTSTGTYTVQAVLNYICFSDTLTLTVNATGATIAQFTTTIGNCDSVVTFNNGSSNATSYFWDFGDSAASTASNPTHTYPATGTYTVTLIATGTCGPDTIQQIVSVQTQPTASITGTSGICAGQSVILTASGGTNVQWSGGSSATTSSIIVSPTSTTIYYATVSNGSCASVPDTFVVTVDTLPTVQISGTDSMCAGQNIILTASGGSNYQWSGGSSATTSSINVSPASTTTYYVTTTNGVCTSNPDTFVVAVTPIQNVTIVGPTTVCLGQSVTLTATGASSYQWSGGSNATTAAISISPTTNTVYYASPGVSACPGTPDTIVINVVPTPILNVSGNTTICAGQSTTLTATGGTFYQWSGGATDTTASITVSPTATTTYFVTTSNGICSSPYDTITVVVTPSPTVTIIAPAMICPGAGVTLTAVGNATTYVWAGGASGTGTTITDNPTSPTNYYLVGYNSLGCSDTDMVSVGIYDAMAAAILGVDSICIGESTTLSCAGNGTFVWGPSTGLNTTTGSSVIATPTATITYSVTFTDVNGCSSTDAVTIQVDPCTGIADDAQQENQFILQPNPAMSSTTILFSGTGLTTISIYNAVGQLVSEQQVLFNTGSGIQLDLTALSDGLYTIQLTNENINTTKKLLIAR